MESMNFEGSASLKGINICIVGRGDMKNGLLRYYLQNQGGANCFVNLFNDSPKQISMEILESTDLVILDVGGLSFSEIERQLNSFKAHNKPIALFDLDRGIKIEEQAIVFGVIGFFYFGDSISCLVRGVSKMVGGQLWMPRNIMQRCVLEKNTTKVVKGNKYHLTTREIQVLKHLCKAYSNSQIAEALCISVHTVKTHIYNIYQKIGVSNRLEAVKWASENLDF